MKIDLYAYRQPVVILGFVAGVMGSMSVFMDEYEWAKYAYTAIIVLALVTWHFEYHVRAMKINASLAARKAEPPPPARQYEQAEMARPEPAVIRPTTSVNARAAKIFEEFDKR